MSSFSSGTLALIGLTFMLAGVVKGVAGMGLPTVSMGVLSVFMTPVSATSLLLIPSFVTNVWQLVTGADFRALIARLWAMMAGILVGTILGVRLLTGADTRWTTVGLGVALTVYALYGLLGRPLSMPKRLEAWLSPMIGLATGLISGATGVFTIPAVPYLQGLDIGKDDLIQALGLSFTVSTVALGVGLAGHGAFHLGNLALSALAIFPALVGMWLGTIIRRKISARTFRISFLCCLGVLGLELAGRALVSA
ncbi:MULTISPECIES: sulfite exporter TauE/SafE family protein [Phenylobacterium]|uniref:Probable membrane transporter protein n=1 Tax=Phenylobacterium koreense TaxID=266125 RepID=A0ABV2EFP3_9CAUL